MPLAIALAFLEIGNGPEVLIAMILPALIGVGALGVAIALFMNASKAKSEQGRIGWNVLAAFLLLVALGIGACYGYVLVGIDTPGW